MRTKTILDLYEKLRKARETKEKAMHIVWVAEAQERKITEFIERYMSVKEFIKKAEENK